MLTSLHFLAERRIEKAIEEGTFADLRHWKNKPLPPDDMANVPTDLRMSYKILKNSGYVPEEVSLLKDIHQTEDLLKHCDDERIKYKQLKKLEYLKFKLESRMGKTLHIDEESSYHSKVVEALGTSKKS